MSNVAPQTMVMTKTPQKRDSNATSVSNRDLALLQQNIGDFTIVAKSGREFKVYKGILKLSTPYFSASGFKDDTRMVFLNSDEVINMTLEYIYAGVFSYSVVDINVLAEWYDLARMIQLDALVKLIFGHIAEHIGIPQNIHLIPIALELATKYNIDELDAWAIQVMTNAIRGRAVCQDIGANYRSCCRHDNGKRRRVRGKGTQYCINKGPTDTNCDTSLCCKHVYGFVTPDLIDSIPKKMLKKIIINLND